MSSQNFGKQSINNGVALSSAALISPQKQSRRCIEDFRIGSKVRRKFEDGVTYTARVMTKPTYVHDIESNTPNDKVLSRKIKYYADDQEEWADEDQLNAWAYNSDDDDDGNDGKGDVDDVHQQRNSAVINEREVNLCKASDSLSSPNENNGRRRSTRTKTQTDILTSPPMKPPPPPPPNSHAALKMNQGVVKKARKEMEDILLYKMGITKEEIKCALDSMSPSRSYSQNKVIRLIQRRREEINSLGEEEQEDENKKFYPEIGMGVRVPMGGSSYHGKVTAGPEYKTPEGSKREVKMWEVTFDDGDIEDYSWDELLRYRASRPIIKREDCLGRVLYALELFCGEGIVTQKFCERKFNVISIDIDPPSGASMVLDIRKVKYEDIGFVPDFIWASPPCTTFTHLAGGHHRNIAEGEYEKTQTAHDHNILFAQMVCLMKWVKSKNPNLIVVIENPAAQMQKVPMMIEFMKTFGLYKAKVDYCAFGQLDKKPTNLWTNYYGLYNRLSHFRCSENTCPYCNQIHPVGTKSHGTIL